MNGVIGSEGIPIKLWVSRQVLQTCGKEMAFQIEEEARQQLCNLANLPFAFHHIAVMPDCHSGYGMPIGGVLATQGAIIPNAVGVDIGCGMCALKTSLTVDMVDQKKLRLIKSKIEDVIPTGKNWHKYDQDTELMPKYLPDDNLGYGDWSICRKEYNNALKQLGTLGGGNHFIEIQKDKDGYIWIMIHSGSRNLGKKVADYYNNLAVKLNAKWCSIVPKEWELAFLPLDTQEAKEYMVEMQYCVDFALANRTLMMKNILDIFNQIFGIENNISWGHDGIINIAHNYAQWENHFGHNVIVHRKGATLARKGTIGIIPGSQGTKSYIVEGLGNLNSFNSCSHGAGRTMSRGRAQTTLNLEEEVKKMNDKGIVHSICHHADLDEAPGAYKDIDVVMNNQKDLVKIVTELEPIAVIKGN